MHKGEILGHKIGKHWRFKKDIIEQWLANGQQTTNRKLHAQHRTNVSQGRGTPTRLAEEAFAVLLEKLEIVRAMLHGFDYREYESAAARLLPLAANHLLALDDGKKRFLDTMSAIGKAFSLCNTLDEAKPLRKEIAFYDALANNESALRELGDETLKKIAHELTEKLRASTTIDWQVRDNVRARIRNMIRRLLKKYKYPPDRQAEAIDLVLRQAEKLSCAWAA